MAYEDEPFIRRRRFTGKLEPSPTGSYYNPSRYANKGFSKPELNRIARNLDKVYKQDLQYNQVANPQYQTEQDTGYGSTDQFGSGRASPATTQRFAERYSTDAGGGLRTFGTPSGGSITYRPSGRTLPRGAEPTVSPGSADLSEPLAQLGAIQSGSYEKGFGSPVYPPRQEPLTPGQFAGTIPSLIAKAPVTLASAIGSNATPALSAIRNLGSSALQTVQNFLGQTNTANTQSAAPAATQPSALGIVQAIQSGQTAQQALQADHPKLPRRYSDLY